MLTQALPGMRATDVTSVSIGNTLLGPPAVALYRSIRGQFLHWK